MSLREQFNDLQESGLEWQEMCNLQHEAATVPVGHPARERMAELSESYADRLERSRLVRAFHWADGPAGLRERAAAWRTGQVPS